MKQILISQGNAIIENVPAPMVQPMHILVRVRYSCISTGTELASVKASNTPLWKRALRNPQNIEKAFDLIKDQGIAKAHNIVRAKSSSSQPTGYSAAGVVIEVGQGVDDIVVGQLVGCSGAQCAHHAEVICVPRNLVSRIPDGLELHAASTVTLGAIALQGIRRANPAIGETFVVIGLGILGQLTVQLLKANGCRVIGADLNQNRMDLATKAGMDIALDPDSDQNIEHVKRLTDGYGADGVIITAASKSSSIISTAFQMTRKKGRVVLVGDVGLDLNRSDFYEKEIDFYISSSYGPGRYENTYEEMSLDYPLPFVRWTENRNMEEFLKLLSENRVSVADLINSISPVDQAPNVYKALATEQSQSLISLLEYDIAIPQKSITAHSIYLKNRKPLLANEPIKVGLIGAGNFAKAVHLPNIRKLSKLYSLYGIASNNGHNALQASREFGAHVATTDYKELIVNPDIDLVFICTRHNLHADMVLKSLMQGKHVLVEKPLCLTRDEMNQISAFYSETKTNAPYLLTGYNRRFSPHITHIKKLLSTRSNPTVITYEMNAGYIPLNHWVHGSEGGGRNIGEACHIYDVFTYLISSEYTKCVVSKLKPKTNYYSALDNFSVSFEFRDGSIATLIYTAIGSKRYPKETMRVYYDGKTITMTDFKETIAHGSEKHNLITSSPEKGQYQELQSFAADIKSSTWTIPLEEQFQVMNMCFDVDHQLIGEEEQI
jgi:predicted dehydrogenase/threonine dehydrogenase-like Zn-dependent dehydrogenase